jgi:hypothetical protein
MQFKLKTITVEKVKENLLFKENKVEFSQCKTDSDICLTFVRVSNINNSETGLAMEIAEQIISQVNHKQNKTK